MPRIAGVDIPNEKRVVIALTYIFGVGRHVSERICKELSLEDSLRARDLTDEQLAQIASYLDKNVVHEGHLRRQVSMNIQRLREIGCYRGIRHRRGLPVRGQRTSTNARTRKGPKKTVAGKKSVKGR